MKNIIPCLWFDDSAEEAADFYTSIFDKSKIGAISRYDAQSAKVSGRKDGSVMTVEFQLEGQDFLALNGGPLFKFTPAVSLFVNAGSVEKADEIWKRISVDGKVLMEYQKYPFSEKFGWVEDKFGLSWQISAGSRNQKIAPALLFVGKKSGKAKEAVNSYTSLFPGSAIDTMTRYEKGEGGKEGEVKYSVFSLNGYEFIAMDSALEHAFSMNQSISFIVTCESQEEVDKFWDKLTAGGEEQSCGWLIDKFGVAWQIVPEALSRMLADRDPKKAGRAMGAMLEMKKLDIAELEKAYNGK